MTLMFPVTFHKQREGADMVYRHPHVVVDATHSITAVHWSPQFEGPLTGQSDGLLRGQIHFGEPDCQTHVETQSAKESVASI